MPRSQARSLADRYPRETRRLKALLGFAFVLLLIGLFSPIITLHKLIVIENTFSLVSGVFELVREGHLFLFLILTAFSIVLPILKLGILWRVLDVEIAANRLERYVHWMHLYGKWSMLDVFVVAVLVVAVKLGALASVEMRFGLYAFAGAVLLTMLATEGVVRQTDAFRQAAGTGSDDGLK